jgi:DNA-binding MarR family transcriptional regulator
MGKATLAHQRAIGEIGQARAQKLTDAGLLVLYRDDYDRLVARVAELEKQNRLLREIAADSAQLNVVAAQVLKEAMIK